VPEKTHHTKQNSTKKKKLASSLKKTMKTCQIPVPHAVSVELPAAT
jgi:hypothetical protein